MDFHARRFDRAAGTYGSRSAVQERMADGLLRLLPAGAAPARILELGCGTGHLTERLAARFPGASLVATDAAPRMLAEAARRVPGAKFLRLDARGPSAGGLAGRGPFDLAASNAVVQWFPDLAAHLRLVAGLLRPGGAYAVSGFLADNFPELNALLREEPFAYGEFPGHAPEAIRAAAEAAEGLRLEAWEAEEIGEIWPDARAFLERIRDLGSARRPPAGRALTRGRLAALVAEYHRRYSSPGGVRATWRPWLARFRKPP